MVKRVVSISETSLSSQSLAMITDNQTRIAMRRNINKELE